MPVSEALQSVYACKLTLLCLHCCALQISKILCLSIAVSALLFQRSISALCFSNSISALLCIKLHSCELMLLHILSQKHRNYISALLCCIAERLTLLPHTHRNRTAVLFFLVNLPDLTAA